MAYNEKIVQIGLKKRLKPEKSMTQRHFLKWVKRVVLQTKNNNKINF